MNLYLGLMVTDEEAELRSSVKIEVDVLGSRLINLRFLWT